MDTIEMNRLQEDCISKRPINNEDIFQGLKVLLQTTNQWLDELFAWWSTSFFCDSVIKKIWLKSNSLILFVWLVTNEVEWGSDLRQLTNCITQVTKFNWIYLGNVTELKNGKKRKREREDNGCSHSQKGDQKTFFGP